MAYRLGGDTARRLVGNVVGYAIVGFFAGMMLLGMLFGAGAMAVAVIEGLLAF